MPRFRYTVINEENKQLQGTIGAPEESSARKELNDLGFSILTLEILDETTQTNESEIPVFEFEAFDKNQKKVLGTIQAEDQYAAFKRLLSEYEFEINYVIDNDLPEKDKEKQRKLGAIDLYNKFQEETAENRQKETGNEKDLREFEQKQIVLKQQIEFVLGKVSAMLDQYAAEMKPEVKTELKKQVEKILRIKNSTNLDYVRKSAEELLTYIQKEELFLHEESRSKERTKMIVEAQSMMMQLRKGKSTKNLSINEILRQWYETHIKSNPEPSTLEKIPGYFIAHYLDIENENEAIIELRKQLSNVNSQLKQYISLYFKAPSPEFKLETGDGIKTLWQERKRIIKAIKNEKKALIKDRQTSGSSTASNGIGGEILAFTGWLLTFYLIYYFASIYILTKNFGDFEIPYIFYIYKSAFLKYFLTTVFLLHATISLKKNLFHSSSTATVVLTTLFIFSSLVVYLNF